MGRILGRLAGTASIRGGLQWEEICRLETNPEQDNFQGTILTSASPIVQPPGTPVLNPRIVIRAKIGGGNRGGGAGTVVQYTLAGNPMPFSGTSCFVAALICPNENADFDTQTGMAPLPETVTADVTGIITLGASSDIQPTQWIRPTIPIAAAQQVTNVSSRMRQVQGYNSGANPGYLMFFDTANGVALPNGTAPLFAIPVPGNPGAPGLAPYFSDDFITSARVVQYGLYWAVSSTPGTLTRDVAAAFRVDIELFAQQELIQ